MVTFNEKLRGCHFGPLLVTLLTCEPIMLEKKSFETLYVLYVFSDESVPHSLYIVEKQKHAQHVSKSAATLTDWWVAGEGKAIFKIAAFF